MANADGAGVAGRILAFGNSNRLAGVGMAGSDYCQDGVGEFAEESFEELFARYEHKIFNLIYRMVGDYEEAVDLTSDTFVQALRGLPNFRRQAQPYTWLYRIAVNLCKNHFRKKSFRGKFFAFSLDQPRDSGEAENSYWEMEDCRTEPARLLENTELGEQVEKAIAALPPDLRSAVILRDLQGLSYQEMAEILDCTLEAIKSRLFRARAILRANLSAYLSDAAEEKESEEV